MTAKQAKELTNKFILQNTEGEYQKIIKRIEEGAAKGSFQITLTELSETVKARLYQDGYTVDYYAGDHYQTEHSYYTIRW